MGTPGARAVPRDRERAAAPATSRGVRRRRAAVVAGTLAALAAVALWFAPALGLCPPLLLHNGGASMPLGYYAYAHAPPAARGEVVVLRDAWRFAFRGPWLMKRVEGVAGDLYCWRPGLGTHELAGRAMPPPGAEARRLGVPVWEGCRALAAGELVAYGRGASYDSRHIGPVREADLWGVYRPVRVGP